MNNTGFRLQKDEPTVFQIRKTLENMKINCSITGQLFQAVNVKVLLVKQIKTHRTKEKSSTKDSHHMVIIERLSYSWNTRQTDIGTRQTYRKDQRSIRRFF